MVRFLTFSLLLLLGFATVVAASLGGSAWWVLAVIALPLLALGVCDVLQRKHSVLRNFPVIGHLRYLLESVRPELQQYFIERNYDGRPFDRDTRSLIYERAKGRGQHKAFGTELDVYSRGTSTCSTRPRRWTRRPSPTGYASAAPTAPAVRHGPAERLRHELRLVVRER